MLDAKDFNILSELSVKGIGHRSDITEMVLALYADFDRRGIHQLTEKPVVEQMERLESSKLIT